MCFDGTCEGVVLLLPLSSPPFLFLDQTCSPDITSIVVPIAVGAALAGLVVLVIVVWIAGKLWEKYKAKKSGGGVSYDKL